MYVHSLNVEQLNVCAKLFLQTGHILYSEKQQWTLVVNIWQITAIHQVLFANFHCFHNIPYANGLQFA